MDFLALAFQGCLVDQRRTPTKAKLRKSYWNPRALDRNQPVAEKSSPLIAPTAPVSTSSEKEDFDKSLKAALTTGSLWSTKRSGRWQTTQEVGEFVTAIKTNYAKAIKKLMDMQSSMTQLERLRAIHRYCRTWYLSNADAVRCDIKVRKNRKASKKAAKALRKVIPFVFNTKQGRARDRLLVAPLVLPPNPAPAVSAPPPSSVPSDAKLGDQRLVRAVFQGQIRVLANLPPDWAQIVSSNTKGFPWKGWTLLEIAAWTGNVAILVLLLKAGGEVNRVNQWGQTLLHIACLRGNAGIVEALLNAGAAQIANPRRGDQGQLPIHICAFKGYIDCGRLLLARHPQTAQALVENITGPCTVTGLATENGKIDFTLMCSKFHQPDRLEAVNLLRNLPESQAYLCSEILLTCPLSLSDLVGCPVPVLREFVNHTGQSPMPSFMFEALQRKNREVLLWLLTEFDCEAPIWPVNEVLISAIRSNDVEIVRLLLDNLNAEAISAAGSAAFETLQLVLSRNPSLAMNSTVPYSALHNAVLLVDPANVRLLLQHRAPVDAVSRYGSTPLECAAGTGSVEIVRLLLDAKASPNTTNAQLFMRTPLHVAAGRGDVSSVEALLNANANVNSTTRGSTALDLAIAAGLPNVIELLKARGGTQRQKKGGEFRLMEYSSPLPRLGRAEVPPALDLAQGNSTRPLPQWKTVRLFISSTFLDMQAERDILVKLVLPRLRRECEKRCLHLLEIDLRWGITQEQAQSGQTLELCLRECERADILISFLGERYGWVPDLPAHLRHGFKPGQSITELEIERFRATKRPMILLQREKPDLPEHLVSRYRDDGHAKVDLLAKRLAAARYAASVGQSELVLPDLEQLLLNKLRPLLEGVSPAVQMDGQALENHYHHLMLEQRAADFVGRERLVDEILTAAREENQRPLVLVAESGGGKSALMAHVAKKLSEEAATFVHFVGASSDSVDVSQLIKRLADLFHLEGVTVDNFAELISTARIERRTIVFIDALNQLSESHNAHDLRWLPRKLPSDVSLVLSCVPGPLATRLQGCRQIAVPSLRPEEASEVLAGLLSRYHKQLSSSQAQALLSKASLPLYLRVAAEELRLFGHFDQLSDKIASMASTPLGLLEQVIARVVAEFPSAATALALIECSPGGLPEAVAAELIPNWGSVLASIAHLLRPLEQEPVLDFFHRLVSKVVRNQFLQTEDSKIAYHNQLADFYLTKDETYMPRIRNLTFHLHGAGRVATPLLTFEPIALKIEAGLAHALLADFGKCEEEAAKPFRNWLLRNIGILSSQPHLARQTAVNAGLLKMTDVRPLLRLQKLPPAHSALITLNCPAEVNALAWSGSLLYAGLKDGTLQLWDPERAVLIAQLRAHNDRITALSSSPSGTASLAADGTVIIWNEQTVVERHTVGLKPNAEALAIAWMGDLLAVGSNDSTVTILGRSNWTIPTSGPVEALFFHEGILAIGAERNVLLYEVNSRKIVATLAGHTKPVKAICWHKGHWFSGGQDKMLLCWPTGRGTLNSSSSAALWSDSVVTLSSGPGGLAVGSWDKSLQLINANMETESSAMAHSHFLRAVAYSPSGNLLASAGVDMTILLWNPHSVSGGGGEHHSKIIRGLAYASGVLASGSWDRSAKLWNAELEERIALSGHSKRINSCSLSADGKVLVTGGADKTALVWSTANGNRLNECRCSAPVLSTALSHEGRYMLSGDASGTIRVWEKGEEIGTLSGHSGWVSALAFAPGSRRFASGDTSGLVRLWDSAKGESLESYPGHVKPILGLAFSPSGRLLATASEDRSGRVWNLESGHPVGVLVGHTHELTAVVFIDESTLATSSSDCSVRLWTVGSGGVSLLHSVFLPNAIVSLVALDETHFAAGDTTGTIHRLEYFK